MFKLKTDYTVIGKGNLPEDQLLSEQELHKTGARTEESHRRPWHVSTPDRRFKNKADTKPLK
jgi:hypothetical protein